MSEINFLWEQTNKVHSIFFWFHPYDQMFLFTVICMEFFFIHQVWKKSMDCLPSIALVIGENVCEIKRQKFRIWNMEGEVMTKGTDERGSVLRQCWGESRSTRTNRKQLVDVRQVWDGEMLEVEKKDKELALLLFSFPLCPSFLSLLLVFLVVWASDSCALV